jgi:hypothetical protein
MPRLGRGAIRRLWPCPALETSQEPEDPGNDAADDRAPKAG